MISHVQSLAINGLESTVIDIEVDINNGLPAFTIVWLPDQWVQESKERLRSALKSSQTRLPMTRITVNLAPASIKKSWPSFDLAIAVWILRNDWWINDNILISNSIFVWELALDWKLRNTNSVLPMTIGAKEKGFTRIFLPSCNAQEASIIPWIDVIAIDSLEDLIKILNNEKECTPEKTLDFEQYQSEGESSTDTSDFKYVIGQEHAKRALEIAAAGGHNLIMEWPPWSWKTMLAKAFSWILPNLSVEESIEISKIYSISGMLDSKTPIIRDRPFRMVHHTASGVSIIWWWRNAAPWEISLSHKGVLFLDEILEFQKTVLDVLRQPLEDWEITVTRVNASYKYPAKFTLIWALNPCPCWYLTDGDTDCICSPKQVLNYRSRLSWPLLDRIDIFIEVPKVETEKFWNKDNYTWVESSFDIKKRVEQAKKVQNIRFNWTKISANSEMKTKEINTYCILDEESEAILKQAVTTMNLSARGYYRILKLSRTIADLWWEELINSSHILEALSFRKKDENQ